MPAGLQVWNPDTGDLVIDISTRLAKELGVVTIGGAGTAQEGSVYDVRFGWGKPFYFSVGPTFQGQFSPAISIGTDNTLRWRYPWGPNDQPYMRPRLTLLYGVY